MNRGRYQKTLSNLQSISLLHGFSTLFKFGAHYNGESVRTKSHMEHQCLMTFQFEENQSAILETFP